jgi:hypothetical protein
MTDGVQEHRAFLDLGGHTAGTAVGRVGMPGISPGTVELATSFHATGTCTDRHGPREG